MKQFLLIFCLCLSSYCLHAQESNWFENVEEAQLYSAEHNTPILMVFAGSDWCRPCIQFKESILQESNFMDFSGQSLSILYLDFPARKKNKLSKEQTAHNEQLAGQFNASGVFPKVLLVDNALEILEEFEFKNQESEVLIELCQPYVSSSN